jgi:hypothetical protein
MTLLFALLPAACIDDGGYNRSPSYGPVYCGQFTSCGTCTPVLGCGWCSMGSKGACVDQPNACADVTNFYWTWELDGCPGAGDAGAAAGGPDAGATD